MTRWDDTSGRWRWQETRRSRTAYALNVVKDAVLILLAVLVLIAASINGWSPG
jgi:hypothetical protein